ncbi:MAG: NAD(P)-dependent oxidoreductase [Chloroflexi bacterium]|nr:NAD(P)-dependent oxidoreductase [Chloroflexota bacterium]
MQVAERPKVDRKARLQIPPQKINKQDPQLRRCNWNEVVLGFEDERGAMVEATRCIQCPAAPCIKACPIHNDIPEALWELEHGNFVEAANVFRLTSTMPEVCGRICPQERLCEGACVVGNQKRVPPTPPVAIGRLEAFVADYQSQRHGLPPPPVAPATGKRVAVVGSGPAGLTVAELVARAGHQAVVYEAWPRPGGILRYGIPSFKLDKRLTEEKLRYLEELGIEFVCGTQIGVDITVDKLLEQRYDAVFLGNGAGVSVSVGLPGEDLKNIYHATDFLVRGNLSPEELPEAMRTPVLVGQRVVVIGGGDTSMDCVRTAVRLGAAQGGETTVTCLYRRTEAEMPGREEERRHAKEEGVRFQLLTAPVRFLGDQDGRVVAVECVRMELGEPDASGRRRPVQVPGSEHLVEADTVVLAVGYWGDEEFAERVPGLEHKQGLLKVHPETGMTSRPGVFAGGDNVRGADLVVTAVAEAQRAAQGILEYLGRAD